MHLLTYKRESSLTVGPYFSYDHPSAGHGVGGRALLTLKVHSARGLIKFPTASILTPFSQQQQQLSFLPSTGLAVGTPIGNFYFQRHKK